MASSSASPIPLPLLELYVPNFTKEQREAVYENEILVDCKPAEVRQSIELYCQEHIAKYQFQALYCTVNNPESRILVQVDSVEPSSFTATVSLNQKQYTVSLFDIYPTRDVKSIADAIEHIRFFYAHIWRKSDEDMFGSDDYYMCDVSERLELFYKTTARPTTKTKTTSRKAAKTPTLRKVSKSKSSRFIYATADAASPNTSPAAPSQTILATSSSSSVSSFPSPASSSTAGIVSGYAVQSRKRTRQVISTADDNEDQEAGATQFSEPEEDEESPKKSQRVITIDPENQQAAASWLTPHVPYLAICGQLKFTVPDVSMELVTDLFLNRSSTVILEPEPSKRHRKGARYVFILTSQEDLDLIFGAASLTNTTAAIPGQVRGDGVVKRITHMAPVKVTYGQRNKKLEVKFGGYLVQQFVVPELVSADATQQDRAPQDVLFTKPTYIQCSLFTEGEFNALSEYAKGIVNSSHLVNHVNAEANVMKNLRSMLGL